MRSARDFKKRYVIAVLLLAIVAYGILKVANFSPFEESVIQRQQINSTTTLYVTEGSAGATTKNVYQYYLVPSEVAESDFLKQAGDKYKSFLSTSDESVKMQINSSAIHLSVKGDVYRFTNVASYSTIIYLTSSPF